MRLRKTIILGLMVLAGMVLVSKNVEAASSLGLYFDNANFSLDIGEKKTVRLMADSGNEYVSGADIVISYDSTIKVNRVVMSTTNFGTVVKSTADGSRIRLYAFTTRAPEKLPKGQFEVATIEIQGVSAGIANFSLVSNQVVGVSAGAKPFAIVLTKPVIVVAATVTPTPIIGDGVSGVLKFRVTFAGVTPASDCATNWPVQILVRWGATGIKVFNDVALIADGTVGKLRAYKGEVLLTEVTDKSNLSVFIKGQRHIQIKYGRNGQNGFYNIPGGEISVDTDANKTPWQDFTKYPISPGDVTGLNGVQDGNVDGLDFSLVKTAAKKMTKGNNMREDLNGNCAMEAQDLALLMLTMKDRQEQLY